MKNNLEIEVIPKTTYCQMIENKNIPLWATQFAIEAYGTSVILGVKHNNIIISTFVAPVYYDSKNIAAIKRNYRFLPYMMPLYWCDVSSLQKKQIVRKIFEYLFKNYMYTYIPLHPLFTECAAIASLGGFVEMRQTHILKNQPIYPNSVKQKAKSAQKKVNVKICNRIDEFDFDKAIKGTSEETFLRRHFASRIFESGNAKAFIGTDKEFVHGGIFLVFDNQWCYLLHSWKDPESVKGIIPLLITEAVSYVFSNKLASVFDFEGSVIDSIDDFFASFNSETITYPYIHYAKNTEELYGLISRSINIPGRIIQD